MAVGTSNYPTSLDTVVELIQAANNAQTTLNGALTANATTVAVISTALFANTGCFAVDNELISYTGKTATSFTGCVRGFDGTTAATHNSGATVSDVVTTRHHEVVVDAVLALQQKVGTGASTPSAGTVLKGTGAGSSAFGAITAGEIDLTNAITNAMVNTSAAIAYSKLNLANSIVNADVASGAAIAYSKLSLSGSIVNADVATGAAIAYSKLAALTADRMLVSSGAGAVSASTLTWNATDSAVGAIKAIDFTGVTAAVTAQRLQFNTDLGTAELGLNANVSLPIGQAEIFQVKRSTNNGLAKGKVVYVVGSDGANKTVGYAQANSGTTSHTTIGIITETVSGGAKGYCTAQGLVTGLTTTGLTEGMPVYLSASSAGDMTSTEPAAPNHKVQIGYCIKEHASQGVIFVDIHVGQNLNELNDVGSTTPTAGMTLIRNATTGVWTAATLTAGSGIIVTNADGAITVATTGSGGATNIWIPASAWIPRTTTGAGVDSRETSTNKANFDELLFDTGTEEYANALAILPNNYNNSTVTARFYWTAASGSGGVAWGLRGRAYGDDDALDQAQGTGQVATDTLITANDVHVTSATSAITIAGTPAANKPIQFEIYRVVSDAADTLGVDARLLGVEILYTI